MRKFLLLLLLSMFMLTGCSQNRVKVYTDLEVEDFNSILDNIGNGKTSAYDLREYDECYAERVPNFYCSRFEDIEDKEESLERVANNLMLVLGSKKRQLIILMDEDGSSSEYVSEILSNEGYKNIHYFKSGYNRYVELQDDFVPESGDCEC